MAKTSRPPSSAIIAGAGAYSVFGADNTPFNQDAAIEFGQAVDLGNGQLMLDLPAPVTRNGIPAKSGMGAEAQALMADDLAVAQRFGYKNTPGTFYNPSTKGVTGDRPAPILEAPTWTSNPVRPRTVAAGYALDADGDGSLGTLTVIFRDGTVYNYYDVPKQVWNYFHTLHTKGLYIKNILDGYPRGRAALTFEEELDIKQNFYQARVNQQISGGLGNWRPKRPARIPRAQTQTKSANKPSRSANKGGKAPKSK
jgi:hypothetical protein